MNRPEQLKCCRYLRKSRDDSRTETLEETLSRHAKITNLMAMDANVEIIKTYEEVQSGSSISERPQMMQLLQDIKANMWDIVVVVDISRLSRGDGTDQVVISNAFRLTNTKCLSDYKIYDLSKKDDLELFEHKLQSSRAEYKAITDRLQRGIASTVIDGYSWGGTCPYGLKRIGPPRKKVYIKGDNFENLLLIAEYAHNVENPTWSGLQKMLHDLGIPSPRGHAWWSIPTLKSLLQCDAYYGLNTYGKTKSVSILGDNFEEIKHRTANTRSITIPAKWEPFLDKQRVEAGIRMMSGSRAPTGPQKIVNPLASLLVCGKCGYAMQYGSSRGVNRQPYYRHSPNTRSERVCNCKSVDSETLLSTLRRTLANDLAEMQSKSQKISCSKKEKATLLCRKSHLEEELEEVRKSRLSSYDRLERGVITESLFSLIDSDLSKKEAGLQQALEDICEQFSALEETTIDPIKTSAYLQQALEALHAQDLTVQDLNATLKKAIKKIDYFNLAKKWKRTNEITLVVHTW